MCNVQMGRCRESGAENGIFFECFPHVCPEPVLAKSSFLYINGSKMPFCAGINLGEGDVSLATMKAALKGAKNAIFFLRFPYVCPEPVLAK